MEKCDHCGCDVDCEQDQFYSIYSMQDFVLWCDLCVEENAALLQELGIPYESKTYGIWSSYNNVSALRKITKERDDAINQDKKFSDVPTEKSFLAAKPSELIEPPCKLEYYGVSCSCYDCNRSQRNKMQYKNIFGYTNEELYGYYG